MNWVGGVRSRLRLQNERKQQKEYFEMKRHMKKVKRARPHSPGGKRGISQDLISLQTISKVHDINEKGTFEDAAICPPKRVTVVDLDKATPMKRRNENLDLGPISPVDRVSAMQILDSKKRLGSGDMSRNLDSFYKPEKLRMPSSCSFQPPVTFPLEKHVPDMSHSKRLSQGETLWNNSLSRSSGGMKKFPLTNIENETPFLPYSTPAPGSQYSAGASFKQPVTVHRHPQPDHQHKRRHFWEDESPLCEFKYNPNTTGDHSSSQLRPIKEYNKFDIRPLPYQRLDEEFQRKRQFFMTSEDFQVTPLKKYAPSGPSRHQLSAAAQNVTVTSNSSNDSYQQFVASRTGDPLSACQSVTDLLDDKNYNKLKVCGNFERQTVSLPQDEIREETVIMTEEPLPGKTPRCWHDYNEQESIRLDDTDMSYLSEDPVLQSSQQVGDISVGLDTDVLSPQYLVPSGRKCSEKVRSERGETETYERLENGSSDREHMIPYDSDTQQMLETLRERNRSTSWMKFLSLPHSQSNKMLNMSTDVSQQDVDVNVDTPVCTELLPPGDTSTENPAQVDDTWRVFDTKTTKLNESQSNSDTGNINDNRYYIQNGNRTSNQPGSRIHWGKWPRDRADGQLHAGPLQLNTESCVSSQENVQPEPARDTSNDCPASDSPVVMSPSARTSEYAVARTGILDNGSAEEILQLPTDVCRENRINQTVFSNMKSSDAAVDDRTSLRNCNEITEIRVNDTRVSEDVNKAEDDKSSGVAAGPVITSTCLSCTRCGQQAQKVDFSTNTETDVGHVTTETATECIILTRSTVDQCCETVKSDTRDVSVQTSQSPRVTHDHLSQNVTVQSPVTLLDVKSPAIGKLSPQPFEDTTKTSERNDEPSQLVENSDINFAEGVNCMRVDIEDISSSVKDAVPAVNDSPTASGNGDARHEGRPQGDSDAQTVAVTTVCVSSSSPTPEFSSVTSPSFDATEKEETQGLSLISRLRYRLRQLRSSDHS